MYFYIFKIVATYLIENRVCNKKSSILGCDACSLVKFTSVSEERFSFLLGIQNSEVAGFSEASGVTLQRKQHI
jgi:hypothetical protein